MGKKGEEEKTEGERHTHMGLFEQMHKACQGVRAGIWAKDQWRLSLGCFGDYLLYGQLDPAIRPLRDKPGLRASQSQLGDTS